MSGSVISDSDAPVNLRGTGGDDHLLAHRDPSIRGIHASSNLSGFAGNDTLEASVIHEGQVHMWGGPGDDLFIMDVRNQSAHQGHHVFGGHGRDTFNFTNIAANRHPLVGRIDDFDATQDRIQIEGQDIDLFALPRQVPLPGGGTVRVRVISFEQPELQGSGLGPQQFLAIGDNIFYALEGARDTINANDPSPGEERHFVPLAAIEAMRAAPSVDYIDPQNFVPGRFLDHREADMQMMMHPVGAEITAEDGDGLGVRIFSAKRNLASESSLGAQTITGSSGDDVIDGNTGNDLIHGGAGDDLIAGGLDNDTLHGGPGDDILWGGDGDDVLFGGAGKDLLIGGRGDDRLHGGHGDDTLVGGAGDDTMTGGSGSNRFHFGLADGNNLITDFNPARDSLTFADDVDPARIAVYEMPGGTTRVTWSDDASVTLRGVSIDDFAAAAAARAEADDPIVSIGLDPQDEAWLVMAEREDLPVHGGVSSLLRPDVLYGADGLTGDGPGGLTFIRQTQAVDSMPPEGTSPVPVRPGPTLPDEQDDQDPREESADADSEENNAPGSSGGACFVATAAYKDAWHPDVVLLRRYREMVLRQSAGGRAFIAFYWQIGPILARIVGPSRSLSFLSRWVLARLVRFLVHRHGL